MANEITLMMRLSATNGLYTDTFDPGVVQIDQAAQGAHAPVVIVPHATEADLDLGDIVTPGLVMLRNLDSTNCVTWGPKDGDNEMEPIGRINPGEPALFRYDPTATLRWQASTADVKVQVLALEN